MKNSKEYIMKLKLVQNDIKEYKNLTNEYKEDFYIALETFKNHYQYCNKVEMFKQFFSHVPQSLKNNREFLYNCLQVSDIALDFIPSILATDIDFVKDLIKVNAQAISLLPAELIDKDLINHCFTITPKNNNYLLSKIYKKIPIDFQKDKQLIEHYFKKGGQIQDLLPELRSNREIVLLALKVVPRESTMMYVLQIDNSMYGDKELMLQAVEKNGRCLQYAIEELRNDKDFVLLAMKSNGNGLKFASNELKDDEDIVSAALKNTGEALEFASNRLRSNHSIVYQAVLQYKESIQFASDGIKKEVGSNPVEYLKPFFMYAQLQKKFPEKNIVVKKIKI